MRRHLNPDVCNGCGFPTGACECSTLRQDPTPGYVSDPPEPPEDDVEDVPDELAGKYATESDMTEDVSLLVDDLARRDRDLIVDPEDADSALRVERNMLIVDRVDVLDAALPCVEGVDQERPQMP